MKKGKIIGLALSGGGLRAAAFHLGTLKKLNDLGILKDVDVISSISGGSIVGAFYLLNKDNFHEFYNQFVEILKKNFIARMIFSFDFLLRAGLILMLIVLFCLAVHSVGWAIALISVLLVAIACFFYKIFPTTDLIRKQYDKFIYFNKRLGDLPEQPTLIINSTNLDTGTLFSFTKKIAFDTSYKYSPYNVKPEVDSTNIRISQAVSCSTSVPYIFSPTQFRFMSDGKTLKPNLVDGGIYDNQGIYRITSANSKYKADIAIVSDASAPFKKKYYGINPVPVMRRIISVLMRRIRSVQFQDRIYEESERDLWEIGYFSLDWNYENCLLGFWDAFKNKKIRPHLVQHYGLSDDLRNDKVAVISKLKESIHFDSIICEGLSNDQIELVAKIGTNLTALHPKVIDLLIKHASTLVEIQIKLYCPTLL